MIVGVWVDKWTATIENRITIFSDADGQLHMTNEFSDGSKTTLNLRETDSPMGRRFDAGDPEDYYVLDAEGNLQIWDSFGLIRTAERAE